MERRGCGDRPRCSESANPEVAASSTDVISTGCYWVVRCARDLTFHCRRPYQPERGQASRIGRASSSPRPPIRISRACCESVCTHHQPQVVHIVVPPLKLEQNGFSDVARQQTIAVCLVSRLTQPVGRKSGFDFKKSILAVL